MKKNKGFTLIELLGVIIILAVIALIATPATLNYIEESKSKAYETSVEGILRAVDNYYYSSKINKNVTYPKEFVFPNSKDELKLKGRIPDSGRIVLYSDGTTYLEVMYDNILYSKYQQEDEFVENRMEIAEASEWTTNGSGVLISYNAEIDANEQLESINNRFNYFLNSLIFSMQYASQNTLGDYGLTVPNLDLTKTLRENINDLEANETLNNSEELPQNLTDELNKIIDNYLNVKTTYGGAVDILVANDKQIPHTIDALNNYSNGNTDFEEYSAFFEIVNSFELVIPSHIKHDDGSLERIIEIGDNNNPIKMNAILGNVIISPGINKINSRAFVGNAITNVVIPNTIQNIGNYAFSGSIIRELIIPGSIKKIETGCFNSNSIKTLTLSEGVEEIGNSAFESNDLEIVKFPLSLKKVGDYAFYGNPLQKVYRYRDSSISFATTSLGIPGAVPVEYID